MRTGIALLLIGALAMPSAVVAQQSPPEAAAPGDSVPTDAARRAQQAVDQATPSPELLAAVRSDAARLLGVAAASIEFSAIEAVVWPDGGLGCARPGEMVTMVQTPGFRLQARTPGDPRLLVYHTNRRRYFRLCPTAVLRPLPPPTLPDR
jgi:hypothetical protein